MLVCIYACVCGWVWVRLCVCIHTYLYNYIICFVHMGYFVILWGGGGDKNKNKFISEQKKVIS